MRGWLMGWKKIGAFIGFNVKTTLNYYKKHGLPVQRMPGTNKPVALPEKLTNWLKREQLNKTG
jgi:hypothetical protein